MDAAWKSLYPRPGAPAAPPGGRVRGTRGFALALFAVVLLAGCGGGGGGSDGGTPPPGGGTGTPPTLTATVPADGATNVVRNVAIALTFSEAMETAATEGAVTAMPAAPGTFAWSAGNTVLTLTPDANLAASTAYTVTVGTAARDAEGDAPAAALSFAFTTGSTVSTGSGNWDEMVWDMDTWQ